MENIKDSTLVTNLLKGDLPEVKTSVTVDPKAIQSLVLGIVIAAVAIILLWKLLK